MKNVRRIKTLLPVCLAIALSACAGTVNRTPTAETADTQGIYNGIWQVQVSKHGGRQEIGSWILSCGDMSNQFNVQVLDGIITFSDEDMGQTYYVAKNGDFKATIPIASKARESAQSDLTMANGNVRIILQGNLEKGVGRVTHGIAEFGFDGCKAKTKMIRLGDAAKPVGA